MLLIDKENRITNNNSFMLLVMRFYFINILITYPVELKITFYLLVCIGEIIFP